MLTLILLYLILFINDFLLMFTLYYYSAIILFNSMFNIELTSIPELFILLLSLFNTFLGFLIVCAESF